MEMLKLLQDKSKKSVKTEEKDTSDSAGSEEDSSADNRERLRGAGKALKAYRKEKREMQKNPKRHVRRYIKEVEAVLGVSRDTPYLLTDFTKRISWGKHRTLQRLHYAISDTLQLQLAGHTDRAGLQMTQILRAIHQCSLDQGDWRVAWHLLHLQDPVEKPRFGGEPAIGGSGRLHSCHERPGEKIANVTQPQPERGRSPRKSKGGKGKRKEEEGRGRKSGRVRNASPKREPRSTRQKRMGGLFSLIHSQHDGSFSRFYRTLMRSQDETRGRTPSESTGVNSALFPSVLPWVVPPGRHRRGRSTVPFEEAFEWMHLTWALLNFLHFGSPCSRGATREAVNAAMQSKWTSQHEEYARTMFAKLVQYCSHPRGTLGCGSTKLEQFISRIKACKYDPGVSIDEMCCSAMEVNPDRISLPDPKTAGILDPAKHLKGHRLHEFLSMPSEIPEECRVSEDFPACHKVSDEHWPAVLRRLHQANMIAFLKKSDVLKEGRKLIKGGLFCVPHKPHSDRLINDRRPANVREKRLNWCQLPSGPLLCQLILEHNESIRASGDDLSNYFYLIKHLEAWQPRNCFGRPFRGDLLPELGLKPRELYLPAFKVLCMGDTNGVDIAQATHEAILKEEGCLDDLQTLTHGELFPASRTLEGLYIDDHLCFQVLEKKKFRSRGILEDETITHKARAKYDELGLPRSMKKSFDKEYNFKAWGTAVDSNSGRVGAPCDKLRQIESLVCALLDNGFASKKSLQKVIGLFIHPFMHRRECMSIFHHVYLFIERLGDTQVVRIPQHIRDELLCASLLLPLAQSNARWPVSTQIAATDASSTGGGRAATLTSRAFAKSLYRFGGKKGEYCRLDWEKNALPPPTDMQQAPAALTDTLMQHSWVTTQARTFRRKEHINLLELEMLKEEICDRVSSGRGGCRIINLCDSRVVVGAYAKGRSSSRQLNHRLRACMAWTLGGDLSVTNLWVDTHSNPADYPSRGRPIPDSRTEAAVWTSLLEQDVILQAMQPCSRPMQSFFEQEAQRLGTESLEALSASPPCAAPACQTPQPVEAKSVWSFKEIFAGKAGMSKAMKKCLGVVVLEPVDFKYGKRPQDILDDEIFEQLKIDARKPRQLWHFGLPCCSFSIIQHSNGGTRRKHLPQGDGSLERERVGNLLLERTIILIGILEEAGNFWSLENPLTSYAWEMPGLRTKYLGENKIKVNLDQCAYGLRLRGSSSLYGPCKKATSFAGNFKGLEKLEKKCSCSCQHVHAIGGIKTKGRMEAKVRAGWPLS